MVTSALKRPNGSVTRTASETVILLLNSLIPSDTSRVNDMIVSPGNFQVALATPEEIKEALWRCKPKKALGIDDNVCVDNSESVICGALLSIVNISLRTYRYIP